MKGEYREILAADCDGFSECGQKRGNIDADPLSMPSGPAQRRRSESGKANKTGVSYRFSLRARNLRANACHKKEAKSPTCRRRILSSWVPLEWAIFSPETRTPVREFSRAGRKWAGRQHL